MEDERATPPIRLMNFISEEQLDLVKQTRGERPEDGTAQRDRPLFEILKENKDKKDAEFNERFKHRPPKALDEDETEFLDTLETSKKAYERQLADEEAQQLRTFQEAVAAQSSMVRELKETPPIPRIEEPKPAAKRNQPARPANFVISVKPQAKKAKTGSVPAKSPPARRPSSPKALSVEKPRAIAERAVGGLVSYSDESDDDE